MEESEQEPKTIRLGELRGKFGGHDENETDGIGRRRRPASECRRTHLCDRSVWLRQAEITNPLETAIVNLISD